MITFRQRLEEIVEKVHLHGMLPEKLQQWGISKEEAVTEILSLVKSVVPEEYTQEEIIRTNASLWLGGFNQCREEFLKAIEGEGE